MSAVNDSAGSPGRSGFVQNDRDAADADALMVDRDLNKIFAGTVRRPPPPLSKKKLSEAKKEFRGTPQRGHGLTVVMGLAVAVGLFGLCVWTLMDRVQDATSNEPGSGSVAQPMAAVAYDKPAAVSAPAAVPDQTSAGPPAPAAKILAQPVQPAPAPAPVQPAPVAVAPSPMQAPPVVAAMKPSPTAATLRPQLASLPSARPQMAAVSPPVLARPAPPAPTRIAAPPPKAFAQMAYNKVSPPPALARAASPNADAMLRRLAAQPLRSLTSGTPANGSVETPGGAPSEVKPCESAESCGSYGLIQAADSHLSKAFASAVEAGVSQQLLGDVKGRWIGLRSDTSRRPAELLADYASLTKSLWRARDQSVGLQRGPGDHVWDDQARSIPNK